MSDEVFTGSCLCGKATYEIRQPFVFFQYCHCSRCRKTSGSAHAANILVTADAFRWTAGEADVRRWEAPDAERFCNAFCTQCGSKMPWQTRNGKAYLVPAGTLDDDPKASPERNIFWGSRAEWYLATGEVPAFEEIPR